VSRCRFWVFGLASSRLKPVLQTRRGHLVGPALAGKASGATLQISGYLNGLFPAEAGPTDTPRSLWVFGLASSRLKPVPLGIACI
jgi:hypothetical protein